jgi:hypothetical protein
MILTQSKPMRRPSGEVVRAIDRDSASFDLALNFVLAEQVETTTFLINAKSTGMGVEDVPVSIVPSCARDNPLCIRTSSECKHSGRNSFI